MEVLENVFCFCCGFAAYILFFYLKGFFTELINDIKDKRLLKNRSEYLNEHKNVLKKTNTTNSEMYRELAKLGKCGNCGSDSVNVYPPKQDSISFSYQCGKCGIGL